MVIWDIKRNMSPKLKERGRGRWKKRNEKESEGKRRVGKEEDEEKEEEDEEKEEENGSTLVPSKQNVLLFLCTPEMLSNLLFHHHFHLSLPLVQWHEVPTISPNSSDLAYVSPRGSQRFGKD